MKNAKGTVAAAGVNPSERFAVEPPARWVTGFKAAPPANDPPAENAPPDADQLLIDRQLFPRKQSYYLRHAQRINTAKAVKQLSQVGLEFNPTTERLVVHSVRVWRDGAATEHAKHESFKIAPRETNLEHQLYDGRMSATVSLEDVQVGDVIDIASTRIVDQPPLAGHSYAAMPAAYPVPVLRWSASALVEEGSALRWRSTPTGDEPESREVKPGWQLHRWKRDAIPALELEPNAPGWRLQVPALEFSDFANWSELAIAIAGLWGKPPVPDALKDAARDILQEADDEISRADAALAFVRDQIRNVGRADGIGSLQASNPADVLRRGFGDCKDKSLLLCLLFRLLKIPASPMLVNTVATHAVEHMLPSPGAFDHVVVCAKIDGNMIWIDPTRHSLAKTVVELPPPGFGFALQISPKAKGLTKIPATPMDGALLVVKENFIIKHPDEPAKLTVEQTASGYEAEPFRELVGTLGNDKLRDWREGQMRETYPGSRAVGDWPIDLDGSPESVTLEEHYEIEDFAPEDRGGTRAAPFGPSALLSRFPGAPQEAERHTPWALPYPCRIRHEVHIHLPFSLPSRNKKEEVDSETFGFKSQVVIDGRNLTAVYRYWSKADHVRPDQIDAFRRDVEAMMRASKQTLELPDPKEAMQSTYVERADDTEAIAKQLRRVKHTHADPVRRRNRMLTACVILATAVVTGFALKHEYDEKNRKASPANSTDLWDADGRGSPAPQIPTPEGLGLISDLVDPETLRLGADPALNRPQTRLPALPDPQPGSPDGFTPLFDSSDTGETPSFDGSLLDAPKRGEPTGLESAPKLKSLKLEY